MRLKPIHKMLKLMLMLLLKAKTNADTIDKANKTKKHKEK